MGRIYYAGFVFNPHKGAAVYDIPLTSLTYETGSDIHTYDILQNRLGMYLR